MCGSGLTHEILRTGRLLLIGLGGQSKLLCDVFCRLSTRVRLLKLKRFHNWHQSPGVPSLVCVRYMSHAISPLLFQGRSTDACVSP